MSPEKTFDWERSLFPGSVADHLSVKPSLVYRGAVPANGQHVEGFRPTFTWWWFENGAATLETRYQTFQLKTGDWIFIPSGIWRRQDFQPGSAILSINFLALWQNRIPIILSETPLTGRRRHHEDLVQAAMRVTDALSPLDDGTNLTLQALPLSRLFLLNARLYEFTNLILQHAVRCGARIATYTYKDTRLNWVLQDIQQNLRAGPLPFDRWQGRTGLSRSQLERLAQKYLQQSLRSYRDALLVSAVCHALNSGSLLVKQVAQNFGFVDTSHFCHWLKSHTGCAPSVFQRSAVP